MTVGIGARVLQDWVVVARLGGGGMGDVWRVRHDRGDEAALKTIRADAVDDDIRDRFLREAEVLAAVQHQNVVSLYEVGFLQDSTPCMIMELVAGEPLDLRLSRLRALPWMMAVEIVAQTLAGLSAAHALGVIHRDIKPANILLQQEGSVVRVRVADFGIARFVDGAISRLTATGVITGTVDYMSPEQLQDHPLDGRSDVYSAGLTLFHLLAGRLPFAELAPVPRALRRIVEDAPNVMAPAGLPELPSAVVQLVTSLVQRRADQRPTAAAALSILRSAIDHPHDASRTETFIGHQFSVAPSPQPAPSAPQQTRDAVGLDDELVASLPRVLVVARLPASRLALPAERRWLANVVTPARGYTFGAYWFAVLDGDDAQRRATELADAVAAKYGTHARVTTTTVPGDFAISTAAALGTGALPDALTKAMATLST